MFILGLGGSVVLVVEFGDEVGCGLIEGNLWGDMRGFEVDIV